MDPAYPKPDRSNVPRNFTKTPENEVIDVGWQEGTLEDGRPYHGEYWAQDQVGVMTFFFSTKGIENSTKEEMEALVEREGLLRFKPGKRYVQLAEGTHSIIMEKNRLELFKAVQAFLDEAAGL